MKNPFQKTLIKLSNWNYVIQIVKIDVNNSFGNNLRTANNLATLMVPSKNLRNKKIFSANIIDNQRYRKPFKKEN